MVVTIHSSTPKEMTILDQGNHIEFEYKVNNEETKKPSPNFLYICRKMLKAECYYTTYHNCTCIKNIHLIFSLIVIKWKTIFRVFPLTYEKFCCLFCLIIDFLWGIIQTAGWPNLILWSCLIKIFMLNTYLFDPLWYQKAIFIIGSNLCSLSVYPLSTF